jgi:hypothetical protein
MGETLESGCTLPNKLLLQHTAATGVHAVLEGVQYPKLPR